MAGGLGQLGERTELSVAPVRLSWLRRAAPRLSAVRLAEGVQRIVCLRSAFGSRSPATESSASISVRPVARR